MNNVLKSNSTTKGISNLNKFVGFFMEKSGLNVEKENKPAYFRAHLLMGRLYYNFIYSEPQKTIECLKKCLYEYETCIKYYEKNQADLPSNQTEADMARQMCLLLPMKINEINSLL